MIIMMMMMMMMTIRPELYSLVIKKAHCTDNALWFVDAVN